MDRPITQREIEQARERAANPAYQTILNTCGQMIPIQLRAPNGEDFFVAEQTIALMPGAHAQFPTSRLYPEQIINHQKAGRIRVVAETVEVELE